MSFDMLDPGAGGGDPDQQIAATVQGGGPAVTEFETEAQGANARTEAAMALAISGGITEFETEGQAHEGPDLSYMTPQDISTLYATKRPTAADIAADVRHRPLFTDIVGESLGALGESLNIGGARGEREGNWGEVLGAAAGVLGTPAQYLRASALARDEGPYGEAYRALLDQGMSPREAEEKISTTREELAYIRAESEGGAGSRLEQVPIVFKGRTIRVGDLPTFGATAILDALTTGGGAREGVVAQIVGGLIEAVSDPTNLLPGGIGVGATVKGGTKAARQKVAKDLRKEFIERLGEIEKRYPGVADEVVTYEHGQPVLSTPDAIESARLRGRGVRGKARNLPEDEKTAAGQMRAEVESLVREFTQRFVNEGADLPPPGSVLREPRYMENPEYEIAGPRVAEMSDTYKKKRAAGWTLVEERAAGPFPTSGDIGGAYWVKADGKPASAADEAALESATVVWRAGDEYLDLNTGERVIVEKDALGGIAGVDVRTVKGNHHKRLYEPDVDLAPVEPASYAMAAERRLDTLRIQEREAVEKYGPDAVDRRSAVVMKQLEADIPRLRAGVAPENLETLRFLEAEANFMDGLDSRSRYAKLTGLQEDAKAAGLPFPVDDPGGRGVQWRTSWEDEGTFDTLNEALGVTQRKAAIGEALGDAAAEDIPTQARRLRETASGRAATFLTDVREAAKDIFGEVPDEVTRNVLKREEGIAEKLAEGRVVSDALRTTVVTSEDPQAMFPMLIQALERKGYRVADIPDAVTDRFRAENARSDNYRDVALKMEHPEAPGVYHEIEVLSPNMFRAKTDYGHSAYEIARSAKRWLRRYGDDPDVRAIADQADDFQARIYEAAFAADQAGRPAPSRFSLPEGVAEPSAPFSAGEVASELPASSIPAQSQVTSAPSASTPSAPAVAKAESTSPTPKARAPRSTKASTSAGEEGTATPVRREMRSTRAKASSEIADRLRSRRSVATTSKVVEEAGPVKNLTGQRPPAKVAATPPKAGAPKTPAAKAARDEAAERTLRKAMNVLRRGEVGGKAYVRGAPRTALNQLRAALRGELGRDVTPDVLVDAAGPLLKGALAKAKAKDVSEGAQRALAEYLLREMRSRNVHILTREAETASAGLMDAMRSSVAKVQAPTSATDPREAALAAMVRDRLVGGAPSGGLGRRANVAAAAGTRARRAGERTAAASERQGERVAMQRARTLARHRMDLIAQQRRRAVADPGLAATTPPGTPIPTRQPYGKTPIAAGPPTTPIPPTTTAAPPPGGGGDGITFLSVWNMPREVKAAFDVSMPLRQGLILLSDSAISLDPQKRLRAWHALRDMTVAVRDEAYARRLVTEMQSDPLYYQALDDGVYLSDWAADAPHAAREEYFTPSIAERIPWLREGIRASNRNAVTFLNSMRFGTYRDMVQARTAVGRPMSQQERKALARAINVFSGRGYLGSLEAGGGLLNNIGFSPRFAVSRAEAPIEPLRASVEGYADLARWEAAAMVKTVAAVSSFAGLAMLAGFSVEADPRSTQFGKVKLPGGTTIDLWGGMQQVAVLTTRTALWLANEPAYKSSAGKVTRIGANNKNPYDAEITEIWGRFFESKAHPSLSTILAYARAEDFVGQPFGPRAPSRGVVGGLADVGRSLVVPLGWDSIGEAIIAEGLIGGAFAGALSFLGAGVQGPLPSKKAKPAPAQTPAPASRPSAVPTGSAWW